jgi:hypothetical protein
MRLHSKRVIICKDPRPGQLKKYKELNEYASTVKFMKNTPLNYRRDPKDKRDFLLEGSLRNIQESILALPSKVDYTVNMSPVKDQGYLGSCVGFAVTAMKEWQEQHEHEQEVAAGKRDTRKGRAYDLSESWVYWNAKKIDSWPGEEGTSIRYAMKVLNKIGVPTEKAWPYDDVNFGKPKRWANMVARWALIDSYWRISSLPELKLALAESPVPIGIPCFYEIFFVGNDGIISYPANPDNIYGGHAVCAVGYNDSYRLVKIKNSWGESWGENGYGYVPYDYIEDFLWDAWTCKDLSVTREMLKGDRSL